MSSLARQKTVKRNFRRGCGVQDPWNLPCRMGRRLPRPNLLLAVAKLVKRDFQFPFELWTWKLWVVRKDPEIAQEEDRLLSMMKTVKIWKLSLKKYLESNIGLLQTNNR